MTVKELRDLLKDVPDDNLVVLSKDSEGNGYSPLASSRVCVYRAECSWAGEIGYAELTDAMRAQGYGDEDIITDGRSAIVLWPTN